MSLPEPNHLAGETQPVDFVKVLRRSQILTDARVDEIRSKVLAGDYPFDADRLAKQLVVEGVLTDYQIARLLKNKPHGMAIGKYVILDKIGAGSMGRVYRARHQLMGREVALKIIAPELSANSRVVARFQREMKMVGRLDHPNVVRAFDADSLGSALYIVMEYVLGKSMGELFRARGPLPALEVCRYAAEAARGLGHAHEQGIVHRDVKPSNVLVGEDRRVRVLDLGLGVLLEADNQSSFATADGIAVGTIDYMSPEQACGREVDGRSDLYSLGCTMYHVISGQRAFPGDSDVERLGKRINGDPQPLVELVRGLPASVSKVMERLLANKPKDRFQSAEEAADALEAVAGRRHPSTASGTSSATAAKSQAGVAAKPAAPAPQPIIKIVEKLVQVPVHPVYPHWFAPFAALAEHHAANALVMLIFGVLVVFGLGALVGFFLPH
jgi:serine/threonine-protein kinase